jgi:hypothetical protein
LLAEGRLRNVQAAGGMGEVQLLRSGDEVFEMAELHGWSRLEFNPFYPSFSSFSCSQKMIISNFGFAPGEATVALRNG